MTPAADVWASSPEVADAWDSHCKAIRNIFTVLNSVTDGADGCRELLELAPSDSQVLEATSALAARMHGAQWSPVGEAGLRFFVLTGRLSALVAAACAARDAAASSHDGALRERHTSLLGWLLTIARDTALETAQFLGIELED